MSDWKEICLTRKAVQLASIPTEWVIQLPSKTQTNVMKVPRDCGLLTARELHITETTNVGILLNKLHSAEWSSVEVTTAFYKRSVIAQQMVHSIIFHPLSQCQ
jgi:amidase